MESYQWSHIMESNRHIQTHDGQESDRAHPAWMGKFQGLIVPDKPNNLLRKEAWLGGWGEHSG